MREGERESVCERERIILERFTQRKKRRETKRERERKKETENKGINEKKECYIREGERE